MLPCGSILVNKGKILLDQASGDDFVIENTSVVCQQECTDNADCSDGLYCNGQETCVAGQCIAGNEVSCSANNIYGIASCANNPDNNPFTWDVRNAFTSVCREPVGTCSTGIETITHTAIYNAAVA